MKKGNRETEKLLPKLTEYHSRSNHSILEPLKNLWHVLNGRESKAYRLKNHCCSDLPLFFLLHGIVIGHPYGITLSVDEMGADCLVSQNVTIASSGKGIDIGGFTTGTKPKIGNRVMFGAGAIVIGDIHIGDYVLISAGAIITKNIPSYSVAFSKNRIKPLSSSHYHYLDQLLWHCKIDKLVPGLAYRERKLCINEDYRAKREMRLGEIEGGS